MLERIDDARTRRSPGIPHEEILRVGKWRVFSIWRELSEFTVLIIAGRPTDILDTSGRRVAPG
jgi:hypothetical protein